MQYNTQAKGQTMTTATTTKQTAANNSYLAKVKRVFNSKIFKRASEILNADGQFAMNLYLMTFHNDPSEASLGRFIAEHLDR
jgi:hypothetical protein